MLSAMRANAGRDGDPFEVAEHTAPPMRPDLIAVDKDANKMPRRKSIPGAPHLRFSTVIGDGLPIRGSVFSDNAPIGRGSEDQISLIFRNCDADQDGLLSRSEFTSSIMMLCRKYPSGNTWFEDLSIEELDAEFDMAIRSTPGEVYVTPGQFDTWLPTFRSGYLRERRLLAQLQIDASATHATVDRLPSAAHMTVAVRAIATRCKNLESLSLRGQVAADSLRLLASSFGEQLRCIDLSDSTVDDQALSCLSEGCTALRVVRLVNCSAVGSDGINYLAELARTDCKDLVRIVISSDASEAVRSALADLPPTCNVIRTTDAVAGEAIGQELIHVTQPPPSQASEPIIGCEAHVAQVVLVPNTAPCIASGNADVSVVGEDGGARNQLVMGCCIVL